jgi:hypothetical protein
MWPIYSDVERIGDLTDVEVYCINVRRGELSGGRARWIDTDGDTIFMDSGATLLRVFVYAPAPNASKNLV